MSKKSNPAGTKTTPPGTMPGDRHEDPHEETKMSGEVLFRQDLTLLCIEIGLHHLSDLSASHGDSRRVWAKRLIGLRDAWSNPDVLTPKAHCETLRVVVQFTLGHLKQAAEIAEEMDLDFQSVSEIAELLLLCWDWTDERIAELA